MLKVKTVEDVRAEWCAALRDNKHPNLCALQVLAVTLGHGQYEWSDEHMYGKAGIDYLQAAAIVSLNDRRAWSLVIPYDRPYYSRNDLAAYIESLPLPSPALRP